MLTIEWKKEKGWATPKIVPHQPLVVEPQSSVLHYGMGCFEGMKAYIDPNNKVRLFRPNKNMDRFLRSSIRLALPTFDREQLLNCIKKLVLLDKDWIPAKFGYSLYIRPTHVGTGSTLGVGPSNGSLMFVILSPVGPYYPEGFKPVKLYADEHHVRAWPGGTGDSKVGGNYAGTIAPQVEAAKLGYTQVLWLWGAEHFLTEVGTMNVFVFLKDKQGKPELVTPPLDDGTILHGVTRDSLLQLARGWKEFKVSERRISMAEVLEALAENRVIEAFGAGTAAIVSPIKAIFYKGKEHAIPLDSQNPSAQVGQLAKRVQDEIMAIQYGQIPHEWSVPIE